MRRRRRERGDGGEVGKRERERERSNKGSLRFLDRCSFKPQLRAFRFVGHKGPVNHVEYSPSGHLVGSASADRTVRLWLPSAKGESVCIKGHTAGEKDGAGE